MKKLSFGFTLAEVATALAIVGVVAAIVIPMVVKDIQKRQTGAVLGRAVEQIITGNQNMIQLANTNKESDVASYSDTLAMTSMSDLGSSGDDSVLASFNKVIPGYWGLVNKEIPSTDVITITNYSGGSGGSDATRVSGGKRFAFSKFPAAVAISGNSNITSDQTNADTGIYVYIDTNGWNKRPNRAGKDVFAFKLLNNGTLIPATGTDAGDKAKAVVEAGFRVNY